MPISELDVDHGDVRRTGSGWQCDVPPEVRGVTFTGFTEQLDAAGVDLRRVRFRLQVHARSGQEDSES